MNGKPVVTGMGIISAIGHNTATFKEALAQGECGIGKLPQSGTPPIDATMGALVRDFSFKAILDQATSLPKALRGRAAKGARRSPFAIQASVAATLEAWSMARLPESDIAPERIGLVVAGQNLTRAYQYALTQGFQQDPAYLNPRYALHHMDTDQVGTLSEIFGIRGEGFTVGGASASGNVSIIKAAQMITLGLTDICLVLGALTDLSPMELQGFFNLGAMGGKHYGERPLEACRPFDRDHEGFIYGQAAACLVMESREYAVQRGIPRLATIGGGALVLSANQLSDPSEVAEIRAMSQALQQAGLEPADVEYINTHGTSSPLGDETEAGAIKAIFGNYLKRLQVNATKALTGHCLCAAGVVEAIATILQMQHGFLHPNRNLDHPIDDHIRFCGPQATPATFNTALSNSFGFGGIHTSIVIQRA